MHKGVLDFLTRSNLQISFTSFLLVWHHYRHQQSAPWLSSSFSVAMSFHHLSIPHKHIAWEKWSFQNCSNLSFMKQFQHFCWSLLSHYLSFIPLLLGGRAPYFDQESKIWLTLIWSSDQSFLLISVFLFFFFLVSCLASKLTDFTRVLFLVLEKGKVSRF